MANQKKPFCELMMSNSTELGNQIATYSYTTSAINDIRQMIEDIRNSSGKQLVFQKLPRHMRRRAMSHNPKRLPLKYRNIHISQLAKSGQPSLNSRPSRKYRRRPQNLLKEYLRRQRKYKWLETHIWHAKRFHMIEKWGYRLPYASCDKTFRACYRATAEYCLLQDISYFGCIEISGLLKDLQEGFKRLTATPDCGLGITAKTFLNGQREGTIDLFRDQAYPFQSLGKGYFLWRPNLEESQTESKRTLWLWLHPLGYASILEELLKVFDLKTDRIQKISLNKNKNCTRNDLSSKKDIREEFMTKIHARLNIPSYSSLHQNPGEESASKIVLRELSGTLNRFRLTGPLAQNILAKLIQVVDLEKKNLIKWRNTWIGEKQGLKQEKKTRIEEKLTELKDKEKVGTEQQKVMRNMQETEEIQQEMGNGKQELKRKHQNFTDLKENQLKKRKLELLVKNNKIEEKHQNGEISQKESTCDENQSLKIDDQSQKIQSIKKKFKINKQDLPSNQLNSTEKRRRSGEKMDKLDSKKHGIILESQVAKKIKKSDYREQDYEDNVKNIRLIKENGSKKNQDLVNKKQQESDKENSKSTEIKVKNSDEFNMFLRCHKEQVNFWKNCSQSMNSPGELLSNLVVGLNIEDPRLNRPKKNIRQLPNNIETAEEKETLSFDLNLYSNSLPYSSLWEQDVRDRISKDFMSNYNFSHMRELNSISPNYNLPSGKELLQPIPIILIQQPGIQQMDYGRLSYGNGYDIIAPAGYGMSLWISLIMWGCRPGGLRELESLQRESGYELHLPDTVAGLQLSLERYRKLHKHYFRLPPNRRPNYNKLAIVSPMRAPFSELIRDWNKKLVSSSKTEKYLKSGAFPKKMPYYVLRDRSQLRYLADCLYKLKPIELSQFTKSILSKGQEYLRDNCLIPLKVILKHRGTSFKDFSLICLPRKYDVKRYRRLKSQGLNDSIFIEPLLKDAKAGERRRVRMAHKKLLKKLRRRRLKEKQRKMATSTAKVYIAPANTRDLCAKQFVTMCKLWLQEEKFEKMFSIRNQCKRDVFGYMTMASYSLVEGTMAGIGYVTLNGLKQLQDFCLSMKMKQVMFLVRSTNSRHYRFAKFKINIEP